MGFRDALDLSEILPAYQEFLGDYESTASIHFVDQDRPSPDPWERQEAIPQHLYAPVFTKPSAPTRVGTGPATCSTCTEVVAAGPVFAWDTNSWYRTLAVPFPYVQAASGALSKAYVAVGGQTSARATYYLKRLLNKAVRGLYDTSPLGEKFLDDEYVQAEMKAAAQAEASRRSATGSYTSATEVLDEWGYNLEENNEGVVDTVEESVQDVAAPESPNDQQPAEWTYSYWLWNSLGMQGTVRLEQWQANLVSVLSRQGQRLNLAVGLVGDHDHPYRVAKVDGHWVVFLHEQTEPTPDLAATAAESLMQQMNQ